MNIGEFLDGTSRLPKETMLFANDNKSFGFCGATVCHQEDRVYIHTTDDEEAMSDLEFFRDNAMDACRYYKLIDEHTGSEVQSIAFDYPLCDMVIYWSAA